MKSKNILASLILAFQIVGGFFSRVQAQVPSRFRGMTASSEDPSNYDDLRLLGLPS